MCRVTGAIMTDDQTVQPDVTAAAEPAATTPPAPEAQVAAPASDVAPGATEAQTPPAPDPSEIERQRQEIEAQRAEIERQQAEYRQWQETQAQATRQRQQEQVRQQWDQRVKRVAEQLAAADTDDDLQKGLNEFARELAQGMHQSHQSELQRLQQQYQQQMTAQEQAIQNQLVEVYKPVFADTLIQQHGLPPQFRDILLRAPHPDDMPAIAEQLKSTLASSVPQATQAAAHTQAQALRDANAFAASGAGGGPLPNAGGFEPMRAGSREAADSLGQILGMTRS